MPDQLKFTPTVLRPNYKLLRCFEQKLDLMNSVYCQFDFNWHSMTPARFEALALEAEKQPVVMILSIYLSVNIIFLSNYFIYFFLIHFYMLFKQIDIEEAFWLDVEARSTSKSSKNPIYAIDNPISLYPSDWPHFNIGKLSPEPSFLHNDTLEVTGINTPYLNIGMRFTSFHAHVEDSNAGSFNILHTGAPKTW